MNEVLQLLVRFAQIIFVPVFGFTFLLSIFYILYAGKNPFRKRKAYLLSIGGFIGMMTALYLPLVIIYVKGDHLVKAPGNDDLRGLIDNTGIWGGKVYDLFKIVFEPMIFLGFLLGIIYWLSASKNPPKRRIGMAMVFGAPVFWIGLQYAPDIYHFFVPRL
jgi:hypothetical protein